MKNELKKLKNVLRADSTEMLRDEDDDEVVGGEEEAQRQSSRDAFQKITQNFLRRMRQSQLADSLQSSKMFLGNACCSYKHGITHIWDG